jgi:hypothetical protein
VRIIARIEDPVVIKKILSQLKKEALSVDPFQLPESGAPP